jgi:hypothetical protein
VNRAAGDHPRGKAKDLHLRSETGTGTNYKPIKFNDMTKISSNTVKRPIEGYPIPGAPGYILTKDFKIYGKRGHILKDHREKYNYMRYDMYTSTGKIERFSLARVVFAVYKNIDIQAIPSDFIIKFKDDRPGVDLVIHTRQSSASETRAKYNKKRNESAADYYKRSYEFTGLVVKRDVNGIYSFIEKYKEVIIGDLSNRMSYNTAIKVYPDIINDFVIGVPENRFYSSDPVYYIKKYARTRYTRHFSSRRSFLSVERLSNEAHNQ